MALITRLQWMLLRLGLGHTWAQLLFASVLLIVVMVGVLRQDGMNALAKATSSNALPNLLGLNFPIEQDWTTVYELESLVTDDQISVLTGQSEIKKRKTKFIRKPALDASESGEAMFLQTYELLGDGQYAQALQVAQKMTERFPNFQLGQLLYADLLAGVVGEMPDREGRVQGEDIQRRLSQLKTEALQRTRHAGNSQVAGKLPTMVKFLSPDVRQVVVVDAKKSRLYLLNNDAVEGGVGKLRVVFDAYVSMGNNGIGKWREGDAKTPLGVYFIQKHLNDDMLPDLYGSGALTLDYPNPLDKEQKRTGSGIWLHGSPSAQYARPPNATDGCVVLANDDMIRLVQFGMRYDTPVIIADQLEWHEPTPSQWASVRPAQPPKAWPNPEFTRKSPGDWTLVSAFEWKDHQQMVAVLSHELKAPGHAPQRRHSYWVKAPQQWTEIGGPL
jgi:L,D-peptidoglycan transpeptidase YkuD (ErfK/YbiS/YcfS/YnhG family)